MWWTVYLACGFLSDRLFSSYPKLSAPDKAYWKASMVSTLHACYNVARAFSASKKLQIWTTDDFFAVCDESSHVNRVFVMYLAFDLTNTFRYTKAWAGWKEMLLHHVLAILTWTLMEINDMGHVFGMCGVIMEATTPFVNQRWFFAVSGTPKSGYLYIMNGLIITVLWFLLRILLFFWLGVRLYFMREQVLSMHWAVSSLLLFSWAGGFALQILWFRKILKGALKAVGIGGSGSSSEVKKKVA